jgi:hypothetical protein
MRLILLYLLTSTWRHTARKASHSAVQRGDNTAKRLREMAAGLDFRGK